MCSSVGDLSATPAFNRMVQHEPRLPRIYISYSIPELDFTILHQGESIAGLGTAKSEETTGHGYWITHGT